MIASMRWRRAWSSFRLLLLLALAVVVVAPGGRRLATPGVPQFQTIVGRARRFDSFGVDGRRWAAKGAAGQDTPFHDRRGPEAAVLGYLEQVAAAQRIEAEIEQTFANPEIADPLSTTAGLQAERDAIRARLRRLQPLAEAIVQQQVASVLAEEGLALAASPGPPVLMTMSPVPCMLIVSPRDRNRPGGFGPALIPAVHRRQRS